MERGKKKVVEESQLTWFQRWHLKRMEDPQFREQRSRAIKRSQIYQSQMLCKSLEFRDVGAWPAYVSFFRHKMPAHLYNEQLMFCNPYDAILKEQDGEIVPVSNFQWLATRKRERNDQLEYFNRP